MEKQLCDLNGDISIDFGCRLGGGNFGDVYKGMWKSQNKLVAIKKIKNQIKYGLEMMQQQVEIMKQFHHQNVLGFLDLIRHKDQLYLIIEYCEGGNLSRQISKQSIPELDCFYYLKSLVFGMAEVNKSKHIHRDLKPDNILFTGNKTLKICDFGLARRIIGDDLEKMHKYSSKGSQLYACPQLLDGKQFSGKCDVWSVGLILVEMLTQRNPLANNQKVKDSVSLKKYQKEVTSKTGYYVLQGNYHPWFKDIISKMLAYDEKNRASFAQIKQIIEKDEKNLIAQLGGEYIESNSHNSNISEDVRAPVRLKNSAVQIVPPKKNLNYNELKDLSKIKELVTNLEKFITYSYNRAKTFVDTAKKFYSGPFQNGAVKYIVLYLTIGYYLKTIEFLEDLIINVKKNKLPNGDILDADIFEKLNQQYVKLFKEQRQRFYEQINLIKQRLGSQKYTTTYPQLLSKYYHLVKQLQQLGEQKSELTAEDYQGLYTRFIREEILEKSKVNLGKQEIGRTYWLLLTLTDIERALPIKKFEENYVINEVIAYSSKTDYCKLLEEIEELKKEISQK